MFTHVNYTEGLILYVISYSP